MISHTVWGDYEMWERDEERDEERVEDEGRRLHSLEWCTQLNVYMFTATAAEPGAMLQ